MDNVFRGNVPCRDRGQSEIDELLRIIEQLKKTDNLI